MSNCSKHPDNVAGITDMALLAAMTKNMRYGKLMLYLEELSKGLKEDSSKDYDINRRHLSTKLYSASWNIGRAAEEIRLAAEICKPYMK